MKSTPTFDMETIETRAVSLSIVIVNWNGGELLRRCVESITRWPPSVPFEILIVDNASTDGSAQALMAAKGTGAFNRVRLTLIENDENEGFSRANNRAIARSQADMVLLLNADTEVTPGALDTLISTLHSEALIGACGPRLVNSDGSLQHSAWRNPPTPWEIIVSGIGLWRLIPPGIRGRLLLGGHWDHSTRRSVPMLFGTALLVKRQVVETVGALDERFHMYAEDYEWCLRITRGGWRVAFEPGATIVHHSAQFAMQRWGSQERLRVKLRSAFDFQRYSLSRSHVVTNLVAGCAVSGIQRIWRTLCRRNTEEVDITFEMCAAHLKRVLRESGEGRRSATQ